MVMTLIPPLEEQAGQEAFTDTARQREVRKQLSREREQVSSARVAVDALGELLQFIAAIPKALLQTPQGAGIAAIMIGATMKRLGIGVLVKEFNVKEQFKGEAWLFSDNPKKPGLVVFHGSEDAACKFMDEVTRNRVCEFKVKSDPLVIDIFPFEIIGLISEDFGKMSVPDMLMTGGFMALTGDFWKGVGEIVPG